MRDTILRVEVDDGESALAASGRVRAFMSLFIGHFMSDDVPKAPSGVVCRPEHNARHALAADQQRSPVYALRRIGSPFTMKIRERVPGGSTRCQGRQR
jgi:hypothetical protein